MPFLREDFGYPADKCFGFMRKFRGQQEEQQRADESYGAPKRQCANAADKTRRIG